MKNVWKIRWIILGSLVVINTILILLAIQNLGFLIVLGILDVIVGLLFKIIINPWLKDLEEDEKQQEQQERIIPSQNELAMSIQFFYNKIIAFMEKLLKNQFTTSDMVLIDRLRELRSSDENKYFEMSVSLGKTIADRHSIDFLNGKYILQIMMSINNIDKRILIDSQPIELTNRIEILNFYNDLKENVKLITGIDLNLGSDLEAEYHELQELQKLFKEGISLIIQLYKSRADSNFATSFRDSNKLRELFSVNIRNPSRDHITDEHFYVLGKKYYIIPNSAYLRIRSEHGEYDNFMTPNNTNQEKIELLSTFIQDIIEFIKIEKQITHLSMDFFNLEEEFPVNE